MAKEQVKEVEEIDDDVQQEEISQIEQGTMSKMEMFFDKQKKNIFIGVGVLVVLVVGYIAYTKLYLPSVDQEARAKMYLAEMNFERDSFNLALNGTTEYVGFLKAKDDFGSGKVGNLTNYYAGISYLQSGQFDKAIEYLDKFSCDDHLINTLAVGAKGDAYFEKGNVQEAIKLYVDAAEHENSFSAPYYLKKAGAAYEKLNDYANALKLYEDIKNKYPKSKPDKFNHLFHS